jgi:bifunctional DNA-binding transcriptional regulator/antitoxin component of YhaV-PrlF toxin-antitoxin module
MKSTGFGRRVVEPGGRELVLVPGRPASGAADNAVGRDELYERIRTAIMSRIDPAVAGRLPRRTLWAEVRKLVQEVATEQRVQLNEIEESAVAATLVDDMIGLGPLEPFIEDDEITDILANGPFEIYVKRFGSLEKTSARFRDNHHLIAVAQRLAVGLGCRIDELNPMLDGQFADGSRVEIILPPLLPNGGTISIHKVPGRNPTLGEMVSHEVSTVTAEGETTVPRAVRQALGIDGGGEIAYRIGDGQVTVYNPEAEQRRSLRPPDYEDEITQETISRLNKIIPDDEFSDCTTISGPAW